MRTILGIFMVICLAASTTACGSKAKCDKETVEGWKAEISASADAKAKQALMKKIRKCNK